MTEEDVALGQVIRTCLEEIDKCRPYFIGIAGERYGYVPELHEYYKDPELLEKWPWIEEAAGRLLRRGLLGTPPQVRGGGARKNRTSDLILIRDAL